MLVCTHCNAENPTWAPNCQSCQTPLQPSMNCPNCGALVLKRANFCGQCGTDLRKGSLDRRPASPPDSPPNPPSHPDVKTADRDDLDEQRSSSTPQLIHLQTQGIFALPLEDGSIYLGKPNDRYPPDLDLSKFPDADVVSRVHARLLVQAGNYYLEDLGSSNGTYVNENPLTPNIPYALSSNDRISLGRNNLVSFLLSL